MIGDSGGGMTTMDVASVRVRYEIQGTDEVTMMYGDRGEDDDGHGERLV